MVTACPNLGADSVRLWGKYFLAKINMAIQMPVLLSDLLVYAKITPGLQKEFPSQIFCRLTNASFVLYAKPTLRTAQILYRDSFLWTLLGMSLQAMSSSIRTNHLLQMT